MAYKKEVPYGSDVSAGTFKCNDCGKTISTQSVTSLPPCPDYKNYKHTEDSWEVLSGQGDDLKDPYPNS